MARVEVVPPPEVEAVIKIELTMSEASALLKILVDGVSVGVRDDLGLYQLQKKMQEAGILMKQYQMSGTIIPVRRY